MTHTVPSRSVSVVIPALNEGRRIAGVVRHAFADPCTAEVVVVDDSSTDDTAEQAAAAGARVITSTMLGKGASMRDGVAVAACETIVFLDGDLTGLRDGVIAALAAPVLAGTADLVKGRFGRGGGRVTELTAKPMLRVFFPEVAHLAQPLGGLVGARRALLQQLEFEDGYGVDIGLVLDAVVHGARLAEVDIGRLEHDSQPLLDLAVMANEVSRVIHDRARAAGRLHVEQIAAMYELQRQAAADIGYVQSRRRGRTRLLLLDMDGTVTPARFVVELAARTGQTAALERLLDRDAADAATRSRAIAALFRFVPRRVFAEVARALPLHDGAIAWVNAMRRAGFMVGLVSDSYFVAADIVRRRLFADFALAHTLHFEQDVCTGGLRLNPAFLPLEGDAGAGPDKGMVVRRFREPEGDDGAFDEIWAMGDHRNDIPMLAAANRAFAFAPKAAELREIPGINVVTSFDELPTPAA